MSIKYTEYNQDRKDKFWRERKETRDEFMRHLVEDCKLDYNSLASHFGVPFQTIQKTVKKFSWNYRPDPRFFVWIG